MSALRGDQVVGSKPETLVPGHEIAGIVEERSDRSAIRASRWETRSLSTSRSAACVVAFCRSGQPDALPELEDRRVRSSGAATRSSSSFPPSTACASPPVSASPTVPSRRTCSAPSSVPSTASTFPVQTWCSSSGLGPMGAAAVADRPCPWSSRRRRRPHRTPSRTRTADGSRRGTARRRRVRAAPRRPGQWRPRRRHRVLRQPVCPGMRRSTSVRPFGRVALVGESRSAEINPSDQFLRKLITGDRRLVLPDRDVRRDRRASWSSAGSPCPN